MAGTKPLDKIFNSLGGRLFVAATQTALTSVVLLLAYTLKQYVEASLLKYVIAIGVGLIAGFSARRFLKGYTPVLKLMVSIFSITLSLFLLNVLSNGFLGFDLSRQVNDSPDWPGLIQFGLGLLTAWLAIQAFQPSPAIKGISAARPARDRALPRISPASGKKAALSVNKTRSRKKSPALAVAKTKSAKKGAGAQKLSLAPSPSPRSKTKKAARPKKRRAKKISPNDIKFTGVEEHTCPYCLDPVEPHDPRGVKICPVCKTHHHKDCWGITGACQIPHSEK